MTRLQAVLCAVAVAHLGMAANCDARLVTNNDAGRKIELLIVYPDGDVEKAEIIPDVDTIGEFNASFDEVRRERRAAVYLNGVLDPSVAYNAVFPNPDNRPNVGSLFLDMPITPLEGPNTIWAELTVELFDTNNDGEVSLTHFNPQAFPGYQRAFLFSSDPLVQLATPTWDIGLEDVFTTGPHSFAIAPTPGVIAPEADTLGFFLDFQVSAGDTLHMMGTMVIDDGSGVPVAQMPELDLAAFGLSAPDGEDCNADGIVNILDANCTLDAALDGFLTNHGTLRGDLDGLNGVQFADFVVLAENFTLTPASYTDGDFDKDGRVGFGDFLLLAENFGQGASFSSKAAITAVPEPSTRCLMIALGLACPAYRKPRRTPASPGFRS